MTSLQLITKMIVDQPLQSAAKLNIDVIQFSMDLLLQVQATAVWSVRSGGGWVLGCLRDSSQGVTAVFKLCRLELMVAIGIALNE